MCHGHPRYHPCHHSSVNWYYCPASYMDLDTGYESPCSNISFAPTQRTSASCPLRHCQFKAKGPRWVCCTCKGGPNGKGWCTMPRRHGNDDYGEEADGYEADEAAWWESCSHGCCKDCSSGSSRSPMRSTPQQVTAPHTRTGKGYGSLLSYETGSRSRHGDGEGEEEEETTSVMEGGSNSSPRVDMSRRGSSSRTFSSSSASSTSTASYDRGGTDVEYAIKTLQPRKRIR